MQSNSRQLWWRTQADVTHFERKESTKSHGSYPKSAWPPYLRTQSASVQERLRRIRSSNAEGAEARPPTETPSLGPDR